LAKFSFFLGVTARKLQGAFASQPPQSFAVI
jgi:hypothetical protein